MTTAQQARDKEAKRLIKIAFTTGGTVPYSLSRLMELKCTTKVIRAVYRNISCDRCGKSSIQGLIHTCTPIAKAGV